MAARPPHANFIGAIEAREAFLAVAFPAMQALAMARAFIWAAADRTVGARKPRIAVTCPIPAVPMKGAVILTNEAGAPSANKSEVAFTATMRTDPVPGAPKRALISRTVYPRVSWLTDTA